jgi:hypothetical protein
VKPHRGFGREPPRFSTGALGYPEARGQGDGGWHNERTGRSAVTEKSLNMSATLKLTHKAIGAEVRRAAYDIVVDGRIAGSLEMNAAIETPVEPGPHTVQVRNGRNSSRTESFVAVDSETVAFRCTGKRFLPIFLASFIFPSSALKLQRQ